MIDHQSTVENLRLHLEALTRTIGERSASTPWNLEKTAKYIESFYRHIGIEPVRDSYQFRKSTVSNIVATIPSAKKTKNTFLLGAHYDSLKGTVGADDNASAIAVQLEVARILTKNGHAIPQHTSLKLVSFALEEPPAYATRHMGSRIYAKKAKKAGEKIDGMICLEMVGYTCHENGCQKYPFPLNFRKYPKTGDYIGIVGNYKSRNFTKSLFETFKKNEDLPVIKLTVPWSGYLIPNVRLSDHASFWDQGYKAVMITDTAFYRNPHYHRHSDTMEKLDYPFMAELTKSLVMFFLRQNCI